MSEEIRIDGDAKLITGILGDVKLMNMEAAADVGVTIAQGAASLMEGEATPTEEQEVLLPAEGYDGFSQVTVNAIPADYVGSAITRDPSPTVSGNTVVIPTGYYTESTSESIPAVEITKPTIQVSSKGVITAMADQPAGYVNAQLVTATKALDTQAAATITPTESVQTAVAAKRYTTGAVKVAAIPGNYIGSQVPMMMDLTVSGNTVTAPGECYAAVPISASVADGSVVIPSPTITADPAISVNGSGLITASVSGSGTITPTVSEGWVSSVSGGTATVTGSKTQQLATEAGRIITPTREQQTAILSGRFATGDIKVDPIPAEYIITTDADAEAKHIRSGKSAYVNGSKISGTYTFLPWGDYAELVKEFTTVSGNLKDNTTFDNWTASTTAGTIRSASNYGTFTATDLTANEYCILYDCGLFLKFLNGATLKVMPRTYSFVYTAIIHRHPTSLNGFRGDTWTTNSYSATSNYYLAYYKSDGSEAIAATTYGIYFSAAAPTFSSTSAASPTITVKTPTIGARCSTTYFATARKAEIDSENSKFFMKAKVYRVERGAYQTAVWHRMVDNFNEAERL